MSSVPPSTSAVLAVASAVPASTVTVWLSIVARAKLPAGIPLPLHVASAFQRPSASSLKLWLNASLTTRPESQIPPTPSSYRLRAFRSIPQ